MQRHRICLLVITLIVAGPLAGCGKHNPVSPPVSSAGPSWSDLWDMAYPDGGEYFVVSGGTESQFVTMDLDGFPLGAAYVRVGSRYVDVGTVTVGQSPTTPATVDTLVRRSATVSGNPWYLYTSLPSLPEFPPLTFDGVAQHRFQISGSANFGAFDDSVLSVRR